MNAADRINAVLDVLNISAADFAKKCGLNASSINEIRGGRTSSVTRRVAHCINDAFPNISLEWLLSGEEPMYADGTHYSPPSPLVGIATKDILNCIYRAYSTNANRLAMASGISKTTLSHLQSGNGNVRNITPANAIRILKVYPELSHEWLTTGIGPMFADGRTYNEFMNLPEDYPIPTSPKIYSQHPGSLSDRVNALFDKLTELEKRSDIDILLSKLSEIERKVDEMSDSSGMVAEDIKTN